MAIINSRVTGGTRQVTLEEQTVVSPRRTSIGLEPRDFDSFLIEELDFSGETVLSTLELFDNQMPMVPFTWGGEQNIQKNYYPGYSEPSMQILGPKETDVTIKGQLKAVKYKERHVGHSYNVQQALDGLRYRGNLLRISLGDWTRYAFIANAQFDMKRLTRIEYMITFSIVSFERPKNASFLIADRQIPFQINEELEGVQSELMEILRTPAIRLNLQIRETTAFATFDPSVFDRINGGVAFLNEQLATVTGYVNTVLSVGENIRSSIASLEGFVQNVQTAITRLRNILNVVDPFAAPDVSLITKYDQEGLRSRLQSRLARVQNSTNQFNEQIATLRESEPLARHLVVSGDTPQKISTRFYGSADHWRSILEFNNIPESVGLVTGTVISIPRRGE